jgi:Holliday junction resolvase-like predicted endonuclease
MNIHEDTIDEIIAELESSGTCEYIAKHVVYKEKRYIGEVDILAKLKGSRYFQFIEVKSNYSSKSLKKAKEQYKRYKLAFPSQLTKGLLYTASGKMIEL